MEIIDDSIDADPADNPHQKNGTQNKAPRYEVPSTVIQLIEHPCIVKNVDNAIKSLGGQVQLESFLAKADINKSIGASLRPDDVYAKPVESRRVRVNDILLKITVPKRTGRKRKRGSNDPFHFPQDGEQDEHHTVASFSGPRDLLHSMRDNPESTEVKVLGTIKSVHRFRHLPDMQYATTGDAMQDRLRQTVLVKNYAGIRQFHFEYRRDLALGEDVGPPATFTPSASYATPFNYYYRQNPQVAFTEDENGQIISRNINAHGTRICHIISVDAETVPSEMPHVEGLIPENDLSDEVKTYVKELRAALVDRPIMSRRLVMNVLGCTSSNVLQAYAYVGYVFRAGPWKDALIRFGVDPRKDPKYRFDQLEMWKLDPIATRFNAGQMLKTVQKVTWRGRRTSHWDGPNSHLFDGKKLFTDGKVWHLRDLHDPILQAILNTEDLRSEPQLIGNGWFHNGTMATLKTVMKYKIRALQKGEILEDSVFDRIKLFPTHIAVDGRSSAEILREIRNTGEKPNALELEMVSEIRAVASSTNARFSTVQRPVAGSALGAVEHGGTIEDEDTDGDLCMEDEDVYEVADKTAGFA